MRSIEVESKTVDEAILSGLAQMGLSIGEVEIDILDQGNKGFLSIGSKPAKVRLTEKVCRPEGVVGFVETLLEKMGIQADVEDVSNDEELRIEISGKSVGAAIGRRGETLDAIQYLASLQANKTKGEYRRVVVDAENYRAAREQSLVRLADKMAARAIESGRKVPLEHMTPYERRVIHSALQDNPEVTTVSEGEGRFRHVVIVPAR
jgi:spoIIIJ-associated protein